MDEEKTAVEIAKALGHDPDIQKYAQPKYREPTIKSKLEEIERALVELRRLVGIG